MNKGLNKQKSREQPQSLTYHTFVSSLFSETQLETPWQRETTVLVFRAQGVHWDTTLVTSSILS